MFYLKTTKPTSSHHCYWSFTCISLIETYTCSELMREFSELHFLFLSRDCWITKDKAVQVYRNPARQCNDTEWLFYICFPKIYKTCYFCLTWNSHVYWKKKHSLAYKHFSVSLHYVQLKFQCQSLSYSEVGCLA